MASADSEPDPDQSFPNHRLSSEQLVALAAREPDDSALEELCGAERSRRLLALRLVLRMARNHRAARGPLQPVDEAWNLLRRAQQAAPEVITTMTSDPQLGIWTARALRGLRGKEEDQAPLWYQVGQLHAFACAAAIRAGVPFQLSIPQWAGNVVLPTLGSARLGDGSSWDVAEVISDSSGTRIENSTRVHSDEPNWHVFCQFHDRGLRVRFEDAGPYRGITGLLPPEPLAADDAARWSAVLGDAWDLLLRDHPLWALELSRGLGAIVPRPPTFRFRPHSASVGDGFGSAIISAPHDAPSLAATMVHEFQHSKLNAIGHLEPLFEHDPAVDCYSPWRDDPRPTGGLFQGVYAFLAVTEFWEQHRHGVRGAERDLAEFEYALLREQTATGLSELRERKSLTDAGRRFVTAIGARFGRQDSVEVSAELLRAAEFAATDHRLGWRVSHVPADADAVRAEVPEWTPQIPAPRGTAVRHPRLDVKAVLMRVLLADPRDFENARTQLGSSAQVVDGAGEGDFSFVAGDLKDARDHYLTELSQPCDRPGAWSGLAMVLDELAGGVGAHLLAERPELVSAVHRAMAARTGEAPDPEVLAGWLAEAR